MTELSRRRLLQGAAGGGAAVAAGTLGLPRLTGSDEARADEGLVPWRGAHQAGIVSTRTEYAMAAAFEVVDDDLPGLLRDITGRVSELTRGYPDRLDPLDNAALPPSDTGELGYDRRNDGRLTMTLGLGASLFDRRFGLRGRRRPRSSGCLRSLATTSTPTVCTAICCCWCNPTMRWSPTTRCAT